MVGWLTFVALGATSWRRGRWELDASTRNLLFEDQQRAMAGLAEREAELMSGRATILNAPSAKTSSKVSKKRGSGFGASPSSSGSSSGGKEDETSRLVKTLTKEGVIKLEGAMSESLASELRACVLDEIEDAREAVKRDPSASMSRFHAVEEQPLRSFVLLPFENEVIRSASLELLGPGTRLGKLFDTLCGLDGTLWDFYALRTEPGCPRQPVHSDTPFQDVPPLFAAFIALQDVSFEMGPTTFLPRTHTQTDARLDFDAGLVEPDRRERMLSKVTPKYALLKAGDAAVFDMRVLHFGETNQKDGGSKRIFWNVTFRNNRAEKLDVNSLGHQPCIRPGFKRRLTLQNFRDRFAAPLDHQAFHDLGDGLPTTKTTRGDAE